MALTDEQFEMFLDEEIAWRKIELSSMSRHLEHEARSNPTSPYARALTRSMSTLLYAHWEGYGKAVLEKYLQIILKRKPLVRNLSDKLLIAHAQNLIARLESGDEAAVAEIIETFRAGSSNRLRLPRAKIIDTKSNLRYETLRSILESLALPTDQFTLRRNLIDVQLCDSRNAIAHGRASFPSATEVLELQDHVIEMMESIRDLTIREIRKKSYISS